MACSYYSKVMLRKLMFNQTVFDFIHLLPRNALPTQCNKLYCQQHTPSDSDTVCLQWNTVKEDLAVVSFLLPGNSKLQISRIKGNLTFKVVL